MFGVVVVADLIVSEFVEVSLVKYPDSYYMYAIGGIDNGGIAFRYTVFGLPYDWGSTATGIVDFDYGLDATDNPNHDDWWLYFSYVNTDGYLRIVRRSNHWETTYDGTDAMEDAPRLAAYDDHVLCVFEEGDDLDYVVLHDDTWFGGGFNWADPGDSAAQFDVTASSAGFAVAYAVEEGAYDPVYLRTRSHGRHFPGQVWTDRVIMNPQDDVRTSGVRQLAITSISDDANAFGYGVSLPTETAQVYVSGQSCAGDVSGDFMVDIDDLLSVLASWGHGEHSLADTNGDDVVDVSDLLAVLASFGSCP